MSISRNISKSGNDVYELIANLFQVIVNMPKKSTEGTRKRCITVSTQTSVGLQDQRKVPVVLLERLSNARLKEFEKCVEHVQDNVSGVKKYTDIKEEDSLQPLNNITEINAPSEIQESKEFSSIVGPLKSGPTQISKLPNNYNNFVKLITNNERANSTIQENEIINDLHMTILLEDANQGSPKPQTRKDRRLSFCPTNVRTQNTKTACLEYKKPVTESKTNISNTQINGYNRIGKLQRKTNQNKCRTANENLQYSSTPGPICYKEKQEASIFYLS